MQVKRLSMPVFNKNLTFLFICFAVVLSGVGCSSDSQESGGKNVGDKLDRRVKTILVQGQQAFQRGEFQRALAFLDSAEQRAPKAPVVSFNRGRVYTALNRLEAARKEYQRAIALDPQYPEAWLRLGDIEFQQGNLKKALRLYRKEEDVAPSSAMYVKMGQAYTKLSVADSARIAYQKAIALDSTNANAHMMYGQFLEKTGHLRNALTHSRKALSLQPKRSNYQFSVGSHLYQLGRLKEAVKYLKQAADARLLHYPAQYNLGQVLTRLGRENEANRYLARADSSRQLMDQITAAQRTASSQPNDVKNWIRLGQLFRKAGERNQAVQAFNMAATIQPKNLDVQDNLGEMMLAEGKTKEAIQRFQAILNTDRTRVDTWINLGLAFAVAGNCDAARNTWQTALKHRPGDKTAKKHLSGLCQYAAQ